MSVIPPRTKAQKSATRAEIFSAPDILRTGPRRDGNDAEDQTVTRAARTRCFLFEPQSREINLQRGSVLFKFTVRKRRGHDQAARPRLRARERRSSSSLRKTAASKSGTRRARQSDGQRGQTRALSAGQMTYILPGQGLGPIYNFQLSEQVTASRLLGGFKRSLPSMPGSQRRFLEDRTRKSPKVSSSKPAAGQ